MLPFERVGTIQRIFRDRSDAGRCLAKRLEHYAGQPDLLVLALPRGGVPVAYEIAKALRAPLDLFLVRKLGVPGHEELAFGAIATGGIRVLDENVVRHLHITDVVIDAVSRQQQQEMRRRQRAYCGNRPVPRVNGRTVILADDGLATGSTMRAAVRSLRMRRAARIVVAVPTASPEVCAELGKEVDEIICETTPDSFQTVGLCYRNFSPTTDEEVRELLERAEREDAPRETAS